MTEETGSMNRNYSDSTEDAINMMKGMSGSSRGGIDESKKKSYQIRALFRKNTSLQFRQKGTNILQVPFSSYSLLILSLDMHPNNWTYNHCFN
jgi:hypothetical protein